MQNLPFFIARRYLFAKKSHNVINIISAISAIGMAVGTAALIVILSVYNGFDALVKSMISSVEPDLAIVPAEGKFFVPEGEAYNWIYDNPDIASMCTTLQDNVFVSYDSERSTVLLKGVDDLWPEESRIAEKVTDGEFNLYRGEVKLAAVGAGFAHTMGINHRFIAPIEVYYPDASARFNAANPMACLNQVNVWPSCEISINSQMDNSLMLTGIATAREILGRSGDEVSAVELRLAQNCTKHKAAALKKHIQEMVGTQFKVLDRTEQNPSLYKMLRYEKAGVYLIMVFVVLVLGFSIFGSLTMLIIDKTDDIATLRALGVDKRTIRRCFTLEGWMITLAGMAAGLVLGIAFTLLQQHFGIIRMPGGFIVEAYPVVLQWTDVAICAASIAIMGYLIALIPSRRIN